MKKGIFTVLFAAELVLALIMTGWLFADMGAAIYLVAAAVFAAVLYPLFSRLKKETEEDKKKKLRRRILLVLLVPVAAALVVMAVVVANLIIYYS